MPYAGTSDVAEAAKGSSTTINNGSVVVGGRPTGDYSVNTDRAIPSAKSPAASANETKLTSRFDDPTYYSA